MLKKIVRTKNYLNSKDRDYRNDPIVLDLIDKLRNMFNVDFKLVEVNKFGTLQFVSADKQIAVLSGAYSSSFYFRGYYGYLSRTFTGIDEISMKDAVHTYIQFKTNHKWREIISTNYEEVDFLMW